MESTISVGLRTTGSKTTTFVSAVGCSTCISLGALEVVKSKPDRRSRLVEDTVDLDGAGTGCGVGDWNVDWVEGCWKWSLASGWITS